MTNHYKYYRLNSERGTFGSKCKCSLNEYKYYVLLALLLSQCREQGSGYHNLTLPPTSSVPALQEIEYTLSPPPPLYDYRHTRYMIPGNEYTPHLCVGIWYLSGHSQGRYTVYPMLSLAVATPENERSKFEAVNPYARKSASQAVLSRMQLALHATHSHTSRRFALGASKVCLVGEIPTRSAPGITGIRGSMVTRRRPCMK